MQFVLIHSLEKTILFSSHILQEVQAICERVIIIDKGNIVADDEVRNLLQHKGNTLEEVFRNLTATQPTV